MTGIQKAIKICAICLAVAIIVGILNSIVLFVGSISGFNGRTKSFEEIYYNIDCVKIDVNAANVVIKSGDKFLVQGEDVSENIKVKNNNNELKITETNFFTFSSGKGTLTITIPKGTLNYLKVDAGAGIFEINDLNVNVLDLDQGAGVLSISSSIFSKADIDGGAGKTVIDNTTFNNLEFDAGVGKVEINGYLLGRSNIECGVGEVSLNLLGDKSTYSITAEKGIGSIVIDHESFSSNKVFGNGENKINIEGGVGAINVSFAE